MGFRTLEISQACELHIKNGQLVIESDSGIAYIPIEDLNHIMVHGANIRLSTMDLSILTQNKVALTTLDNRYLPTAIILPFEGHSRQSKLIHAQAVFPPVKCLDIWVQIIKQKICNQSRALSILGLPGAETISRYYESLDSENVDQNEALAAKEYFKSYHRGLNRRSDEPINSRLNYGYSVIRSYIARSISVTGFHPTFGIHHNNQLNSFNLADDLIEPYRPMVDLIAYSSTGTNTNLSKIERRELAHVLHNACIVCDTKINLMASVGEMLESLKRIILEKSDEPLRLPRILPIESMEAITE